MVSVLSSLCHKFISTCGPVVVFSCLTWRLVAHAGVTNQQVLQVRCSSIRLTHLGTLKQVNYEWLEATAFLDNIRLLRGFAKRWLL
jgi:hypothetical protein